MNVNLPIKPKSVGISIVVHRANGKDENIGLVSYWHKNAIVRGAVNFYIKLKRKLKG